MKKVKEYREDFKIEVALASLNVNCSLAETANKFQLEVQLVMRWRNEFLEAAKTVITGTKHMEKRKRVESSREELIQEVKRLNLENTWIKDNFGTNSKNGATSTQD